MMHTVKTILCGVDLSDTTHETLTYAMGLANQYRSELIVLHVVEPITSNPILQQGLVLGKEDWHSLQERIESQLVNELGGRLQALCAEMITQLPECQLPERNILIRKGVAFEEILTVAQEITANLIVVGTCGHSLVTEALMGGTARRVIRHSQVPVLVVPRQKKPE